MAAIALNKFRTIRFRINTNNVGIYTCPIGVASIVILAQVTNVSTGNTEGTYRVTAYHHRPNDTLSGISSFKIANNVPVPPNDSVNLVPDGRLALETNDILKFQASSNDKLELILSVLETAKQ